MRCLPRFHSRVQYADATDVGAMFFERTRVLSFASSVPFPGQTAVVALTANGPVVLSGNAGALHDLCVAERPRIDDPDLAFALANIAKLWTSSGLMGDAWVSSVDDIPFVGSDDVQAEIRRTYASVIQPPGLEILDDGLRSVHWVVAEAKLVQRVGEVRSGMVSTRENIACDVPTFRGEAWGMRNGRWVPVG